MFYLPNSIFDLNFDVLCVGLQGFVGNSSHTLPHSGLENLLAKRMALERQRSIPNPYQYWPGKDASPMMSKSEIVPDPNLLSSVHENPCQPPHSQNAEIKSVLQGLTDRSSGINNNATGWSSFSVQGGSDPLQSKMDMYHDQSFPPQAPLGFQQQRLQPQNQPSFPNLLSQAVDNSSSISQEKLLSSGLLQDPQLMNILQQQYLLQLHSQTPVPAQQMSLLDKIMLLKQQQQKQEEELLMRQQQQLLSQVLADHQSRQNFSEPSFGQLQAAAIPKGNASIDPSRHQASQEMFPLGSNEPVPNMQNELATNFMGLPPQGTQDIRHNASDGGPSLPLPHQVFGSITHQRSWDNTHVGPFNDSHQDSLPVSNIAERSPLLEEMTKSREETVVQKFIPDSDFNATKTVEHASEKTSRDAGTEIVSETVADSASLESPQIFISMPPGACVEDMLEHVNDGKAQSDSQVEEQLVEREIAPSVTEVKNAEVRGHKKTSEKKSKKQKSSKAQSTNDQAKGVTKSSSSLQIEQSETDRISGVVYETSPQNTRGNRGSKSEIVQSQQAEKLGPVKVLGGDTESLHVKVDSKPVEPVAVQNTQVHVGQRGWKPAPGFKAKSLLEIQQEEQRKVQTEVAVSEVPNSVNSLSLSTPWAGVVANADPKISGENQRDAEINELNVGKPGTSNRKSKKSPLHDLLAEEVLSKSIERVIEVPNGILSDPSSQVMPLSDSVDDDNFIEAKDTKRSRKKSAKSRGNATKVSGAVTPVEVPISSSPTEKVKSSRSVQQGKEVLPTIPSGPSLGDFVLWKGETANTAPSPAWSTDSGKLNKPTSLRDIQKEQEKRVSAQHLNQITTPQKSQPTQSTRNAAPSWSPSGSSPSKLASPIQINSHTSQPKYKGDDDLFWGPIDQSKQETKQYDIFVVSILYQFVVFGTCSCDLEALRPCVIILL